MNRFPKFPRPELLPSDPDLDDEDEIEDVTEEILWQRNDPTVVDLTTRSLSLRADTVNEEQRSVEAILSTDQPVAVLDWERYQIIDEVLRAEGSEFGAKVPMLEAHMRFGIDSVLGSIRDIRVEGNKVVGRLFFARDDERADMAWKKVRDGHVTDVSVGYRAVEYTDIPPNKSAVVAGRKYTAANRPLRVTTKWKLREGSLVPIGADDAAKIRAQLAAQFNRPKEGKAMNEALRKYLESIGLRAEATEAEAIAFWEALGGSQRQRADMIANGTIVPGGSRSEATPTSVPAAALATPAATAESQRSETPVAPATTPAAQQTPEQIREAATTAERQRAARMRELGGSDVPEELVQRSINEGWDETRASQEFLQSIRTGRGDSVGQAPAGHAHSHEQNCSRDVLGVALMQRAGVYQFPANASETERRRHEQLAERAHQFNDMSLVDICREALRIDGRAIPHNRGDMIRAAVSTPSLSSVFTQSVSAALMQAFMQAPDSTNGWVREVDVPDFKTNTRIMTDKTGQLQKLTRGDSAQHTTIGDTEETYKIARYAQQFVADEQDIIDDAFNVLLDMPREMGYAAARLRPDLVYAILLANAALGADSVALFHSDHSNTATDALAASAIQAAVTAISLQRKNNVPLNLMLKYLIVNPTLEFAADIALNSAYRQAATEGDRNPLNQRGIILRSDARLGVAGVTDPATGTAYTGSTTTWFSAIDPAQGPTIEVGYLRGTGRRPQLRSFVLDRGQWGVGFDIKHDIGSKALAYQGLYRGNT